MKEVKVLSIIKMPIKQQVYDITVENKEHYILENGVVSHNSGVYYSGDMIVFLSKSKMKDGKEIIGNNIRCTLTKGRFTKENKQVIVGLSYDKGLLRYNGLLELAEKYGVIKKISNKYVFPDSIGKGSFEKHIYENPEKFFTKEILDKIDECAATEFLYGSALEEDTIDEEK